MSENLGGSAKSVLHFDMSDLTSLTLSSGTESSLKALFIILIEVLAAVAAGCQLLLAVSRMDVG